MAAYPAPATKNKLTMPTGAPAPGPRLDDSADAYAPGTMAVSSKGNALQMQTAAAPMSNPFAPPKGQPRNALLASAFDGFQRGFDPAAFEKRQATNKADGMEKAKQTLALIQQQRALPAEQRAAWWKQNADTIGGIINQDVSSMPIDEAQFTDQALDGHAAALSAQLGIAPEAAEYMNLGNGTVGMTQGGKFSIAHQGPTEPVKPTIVNNRVIDPNDPTKVIADYSDPTAPVKMEQYTDATGQVWDRNPYTGESVKANVPRARVPGTGGDGGSAPPSGYRWNPDGSLSKIPGGPADKPEPGLYTPTEEKNYRGKAQALGTLKFLTNEYRTLVNQYGPGLFDGKMQGTEWKKTPEGQKLLASHNNLMMFLKGPELFNLGVLTGPDVERLQRTLPEPVGMGAFGQTKETLGIGLDSLDQLVGYQMTMIPEELRSQQAAAKTDQRNRAQNAGAILGGTGEFNPETFRNMRLNNIPRDAVAELRGDPSPEVMAEFNETFGEGAAEAILNGSR